MADVVATDRQQEASGAGVAKDLAVDRGADGGQLGRGQDRGRRAHAVEEEADELGQVDHRHLPEQVRIHGADVLEEDDLGVRDDLVGGGQHLVEGVEDQVHVHSEAVLVLAVGRPSKQLPALDDKLADELEAAEALLYRLLSLRRGHEVGTMPDAAQQAPKTNNYILV